MLTPKARQLVVAHLSLVREQARYLRYRYTLDVPRDELESFGMLGLVEAAVRFDPERGTSFRAFARPRVRGAILDGLGELQTARRLRRPGLSESPVSEPSASEQVAADQVLGHARLRGALHQALGCLPARVRLLVERRYFEHQTLTAIGVELGVSKSRASRLHAAALRKLREALAETMRVGDDTLDAELAQIA